MSSGGVNESDLGLRFLGPRSEGDFDLFEAIDVSDPSPANHVYSCIALCRREWVDGWPALGGTRWFPGRSGDPAESRAAALREAIELADAMNWKNTLLRRADAARRLLGEEGPDLYGWQGGKGVVWTPWDPELSAEENRRRFLTPRRLMCHGRLVERLGGEYIASKDQGVGGAELRWIERSTSFTIGNGCKRDTGEATAMGVVAGLRRAVAELRADGAFPLGGGGAARPLQGVGVLVVGAGKVGTPLIHELAEREGALVWVFAPELRRGEGAIATAYENLRRLGAAVEEGHRATLQELASEGRILDSEERALALAEIQVVSPNGGPTGWLSRCPEFAPRRTRAEILAEHSADRGETLLVLGAGNDQVPMSEAGRPTREEALRALAAGGVWFVPDPLVSPGGVIAVSHELAPAWDPATVIADTRAVVDASVGEFFRRCRQAGPLGESVYDPACVWRSLTGMIRSAAWEA